MSVLPDSLNLQKRRNERKRTDNSLENFASNSTSSAIVRDSESRSRINSAFRYKLRDLHEVRNKKKMSQSMIRSQKLELGALRLQRKESQDESSPFVLSRQRQFKSKHQNQDEFEQKENGSKRFNRVSKYARNDDQNNGANMSK